MDSGGGHVSDRLQYCSLDKMIDNCKIPNLISLCRSYNPTSGFVLKVSITVDPMANTVQIKLADHPIPISDQIQNIDYIDYSPSKKVPVDAMPIKVTIKSQAPPLPKKPPRASMIKSMLKTVEQAIGNGSSDQSRTSKPTFDRSGKVRNERTWQQEKIQHFGRRSNGKADNGPDVIREAKLGDETHV